MNEFTIKTEKTSVISLTKGMIAFVFESDLPLVVGRKWYAMKGNKTYYAACNGAKVKGVRGDTVLMHRLILGNAPMVDHRDGNGLNNRRENLRKATRQLNAANGKRDGTASKLKGVSWCSTKKKWCAYMRMNGKSKNLGRYATETEAHQAYLAAARPIYGEFTYERV